MKKNLPIVRVLDANTYSRIAGELRKRIPRKVMIDIDRDRDESGRAIVRLRCLYPEVVKKAITDVLNEEYVPPDIGEEELEVERREHWQRDIDSLTGKSPHEA